VLVPGFKAAVKNGSTASESSAADAHACIMVRVTATHRIQGCGTSSSCPDSELPSDASSDHKQRAAALGAVKARPGNGGACGQDRATADLDCPCAHRPPTHVGRGEETGFQVEQRNSKGGSGECVKSELDSREPHTRTSPSGGPKKGPALTAAVRDGRTIVQAGTEECLRPEPNQRMSLSRRPTCRQIR
jgi:hypothetical protein